MRHYVQNLAIVLGLVAIGACLGVIVVMMLDPDCGPDGASQTACGEEIVRDLTGKAAPTRPAQPQRAGSRR